MTSRFFLLCFLPWCGPSAPDHVLDYLAPRWLWAPLGLPRSLSGQGSPAKTRTSRALTASPGGFPSLWLPACPGEEPGLPTGRKGGQYTRHLSLLSSAPRHSKPAAPWPAPGELKASLFQVSLPEGPPQLLLFFHHLLAPVQPAVMLGWWQIPRHAFLPQRDGWRGPAVDPWVPAQQPGSRRPTHGMLSFPPCVLVHQRVPGPSASLHLYCHHADPSSHHFWLRLWC